MFVCVDPHDIPVVAIIDPDMMSGMPAGLTAATGMDALTHAIILPTIMEYNAEATGGKYKYIAAAMGVEGVESMTVEEYRKAAIDAVRKLSAQSPMDHPTFRKNPNKCYAIQCF